MLWTLRHILDSFHSLQVNTFIGFFYDATILYIIVLSKTLPSNQYYYDNHSVRSIQLNFTFQVNFFIGSFYDATILYGMALNETLSSNLSIRNGHSVTRRMWNRTFKGTTIFPASEVHCSFIIGNRWIMRKGRFRHCDAFCTLRIVNHRINVAYGLNILY